MCHQQIYSECELMCSIVSFLTQSVYQYDNSCLIFYSYSTVHKDSLLILLCIYIYT